MAIILVQEQSSLYEPRPTTAGLESPYSNQVSFTSTATTPPNQSPVVSLVSPSNGTNFTAPATIALSASATDSGGSISRVEFYNGATLLGADTASPYTYTWSGVAAGSYSLTARAFDNEGASTTSAPINVTVTASGTSNPPVSTPAYVQGNYAVPQTPQTTVALPYTSAQTAGNLNVVIVGWNDTIARVSTVADKAGNVYYLAKGTTTVPTGVLTLSGALTRYNRKLWMRS